MVSHAGPLQPTWAAIQREQQCLLCRRSRMEIQHIESAIRAVNIRLQEVAEKAMLAKVYPKRKLRICSIMAGSETFKTLDAAS
jgi:hypothetical protein